MLKTTTGSRVEISRSEYEKLLHIKKLFEGQKEITEGNAFEAEDIDDLRSQLMA